MNIVEKFKLSGFFRGNELYVKIPFAAKFIEESDKEQLAIIGIEGFRLNESRLEPQLDMIADFSGYIKGNYRLCIQLCNQAARGFLDSYLSNKQYMDTVFNFFLINKDEFESIR